MEIERHLFRISERTLKSPNAPFWFNALFYCLSFLGVVFGLFLIFGHVIVLPTNQHFSKCLANSSHTISEDTIYFITDQNLPAESVKKYQEKEQVVVDNEECMIILNKNASDEDDGRQAIGWDVVGLFMDQHKRSKLHYDNATVILKTVQPIRRIIFGLDVLITNELLTNPLGVFPTDSLLVTKSKSVFAVYETH